MYNKTPQANLGKQYWLSSGGNHITSHYLSCFKLFCIIHKQI